jgi:hypothetical protein
MLRRIITRNYWVSSTPLDRTNVIISSLEETHKTISKIVTSPNPITYSDKINLLVEMKKLDENIISIKKIAETNGILFKYT